MKRTQILRLVMTPKEIADADAIAYSYGMTLPDFVRAMLSHVQTERPELTVRVSPRRPGRPAKRHAQPAKPQEMTA